MVFLFSFLFFFRGQAIFGVHYDAPKHTFDSTCFPRVSIFGSMRVNKAFLASCFFSLTLPTQFLGVTFQFIELNKISRSFDIIANWRRVTKSTQRKLCVCLFENLIYLGGSRRKTSAKQRMTSCLHTQRHFSFAFNPTLTKTRRFKGTSGNKQSRGG